MAKNKNFTVRDYLDDIWGDDLDSLKEMIIRANGDWNTDFAAGWLSAQALNNSNKFYIPDDFVQRPAFHISKEVRIFLKENGL